LGRILALDYGRKRTGVAVTDPQQIIANGLKTIATHEIFNFLSDYFNREEVDLVVVGYPKTMNNLPSEAVVYIQQFLKKFKSVFPGKEYFLMDERYTSKMAFQTMIDGGLKKKQRRDKSLIDTISATIILQSYMEYIENSRNK
jgi:putative Holliday junction resolvase